MGQYLPALIYLSGEVTAVLTLHSDMLVALKQARKHVSSAREDESHFVKLDLRYCQVYLMAKEEYE